MSERIHEVLHSNFQEIFGDGSQWDGRSAGDHSTQLSSRGSDRLTARERDVLASISQGRSNKRIARTLDISPETVKSHVKRIFEAGRHHSHRGGV
jgi:DNA-binding CsgD family transcriptional regulator